MNRKGIFFTLIVISIISLFLISYTFYQNYSNRDATRNRINTLNNFIFSVEENLQRQLFISGFRAIFIMQAEALEEGQYIVNTTYSINELFFNGTFNNVEQEIMLGARFLDIQSDIQQKANKVNADITLENPIISISQSDPWNIDITLIIDFEAKDKGSLVSWNKRETYTSKVPIEGFEDPLYLISTGGLVSNTISKTPFTIFVSGTNVTNLNNHTSSRYYKENVQAPSYLNRLQGSNVASELGIESLVYIPKLSNEGITIQDKSIVDYIYFSINNPVSCKVTGMPSWFKIDQNHLTDYQLNGLEHSCA